MSQPGKRLQILSYEDAEVTPRQHTRPCSDCPFARTAAPGWIPDMDSEAWVSQALGEVRIECHVHLESKPGIRGWQCAGAAIFRSNICKQPRDKTLLLLPKDDKRVFKNPREFLAHHAQARGPGGPAT